MKKDELDRIIVKTNARMTEIIQWFQDNEDWLKREDFRSPMDSGLIIMEEENLDISFEMRPDGRVNMGVYPAHLAIPVMTWVYDPLTGERTNHDYVSKDLSNQDALKLLCLFDRTDWKESIKFHALMMFATYYEEIIELDEKQSIRRTRRNAKKLRKNPKQPLSLVKKTYVIKDFTPDQLHKYGEKRRYTKPDHEVQVRGYYRRTKTGKKVWIKPFSRYKDNGSGRQRKEYKV